MAKARETSPQLPLRKFSLTLAAACLLLTCLQSWQQTPLLAEAAQSSSRVRALWQSQPPRFPLETLAAGLYTPAAVSPLAAFDPGEQTWLGTAYWLQLGRLTRSQDQPGYDYFPAGRQVSLSAAMLLQLAIPFLALWIAWHQRQAPALAPLPSWVATTLPVVESIAPALAVSFLATALLALRYFSADAAIRLVLLLGFYLLFATAAATLNWSLLRLAANPRLAVLALALFWLGNLTLARPITINLASTLFPAPTLDEFVRQVEFETRNGYNGVEPRRDRERRFVAETLVEYKVRSIADLPINLSANLLKKEERFEREVFLRRMNDLWQVFARQEQFEQLLAFLFPTVGVQISSTALAGTNFSTERLESQAADAAWDTMVRQVYEEIVVTSGPAGKMLPRDASYWRQFPPVVPQLPAAAASLGDVLLPSLGLLLNAGLGFGLVLRNSTSPPADPQTAEPPQEQRA